jgi:carboxyl-terminal processing protease
MKQFLLAAAAAVCFALPASAATNDVPVDYSSDAKALDKLIVGNYAYEDHWPDGVLPDSPKLAAERAAVHDEDTLLHYAEDRIASLADHHAITGSSFHDSWAVVPTYSDMWVVRKNGEYLIEEVRDRSPAQQAGIRPGARLVEIGGVPVEEAVADFWKALGLSPTPERADYAARVLAAGRRDRPREVTISEKGNIRQITLASLYSVSVDRPGVEVEQLKDGRTRIRFNNSLGDQATIAAFDQAMDALPASRKLVLDLTETPSGGNTSVARAIMGWFVDRPRAYQIHNLPAEERESGIARQWLEEVLPRRGKHHSTLPLVEVGRWTGSMGEGLAIGFSALGALVEGTPMAQLKGAVYDFELPSSKLLVKFPAERLYTTKGEPRENFRPAAAKGDESE